MSEKIHFGDGVVFSELPDVTHHGLKTKLLTMGRSAMVTLIHGINMIFVSEKYFRPTEVDELLGDSSKARKLLNWCPKYSFDDLVKEMVDNDCG